MVITDAEPDQLAPLTPPAPLGLCADGSTLDAELNDFGVQLAMLRGHAADRDG